MALVQLSHLLLLSAALAPLQQAKRTSNAATSALIAEQESRKKTNKKANNGRIETSCLAFDDLLFGIAKSV